MKAILKSNRKVILDVELYAKWVYLKEGKAECKYKDKDRNVYHEDELDFVEYYGG